MQKNQKLSSEANQCPCPYNMLLNPSFKKVLFEVLRKGFVNTKSLS